MTKQNEIITSLNSIETNNNIKLLLAIESGSRAWGFESNDSDYDVRFIYINGKNWYLALKEQRDVIEQPISDLLDINGWDLRKALRLMLKGNPTLTEWINSPITYTENPEAREMLQRISVDTFKPIIFFKHYIAMSTKKWNEIKDSKKTKAKTYLYSLRALACAIWVKEQQQIPPVIFSEVFSPIADQELKLADAVYQMIEDKKRDNEQDLINRVTVIDDYISNKIKSLDKMNLKFSIREETCLDSEFRVFLDKFSI